MLALGLLVTGCTSARVPPEVAQPEAADPCLVLTGAGSPRDTLRVALADYVSARHAPVAHTEAERFLFRQIYETLVRVDCEGTIRPALARAWRSADGGRRWIFTLRDGARFWDGTPVTAREIVAGWRDHGVIDATWDGVAVRDARTIDLAFTEPHDAAAFASPTFAIVKRIAESAWPLGTGVLWIRDTGSGVTGIVRASPVPWTTGAPLLELHAAPGADGRDLLDQGADLMVTREPAVRSYATANPEFLAVPLPWERVYVLVSPSRVRAGVTGQFARVIRQEMAGEAVRADARAAAPPYWWEQLGRCQLPAAERVPPASRSERVVYERDDPVARDLAERLVAVAGTVDAGVVPGFAQSEAVAVGLTTASFATALRAGGDLAYVLSLPTTAFLPCRQARDVRRRMPWIAPLGDWGLGRSLLPVVETRAYLLVRRGVANLTVDGDGGVRVMAQPAPASR